MFKKLLLASAFGLSILPLAANAQIKVGVTISTTGPAASLGIPEKMAFAIMPKEIAGKKIEYIVLDDASDPVAAVKNSRKFVSEDKVDIIMGSSTTPASLAMIDVAADSQTPMISIASSISIVDPVDAKRFWVFKTPQTDAIMMTAMTAHMADHGIKTVGLIGFNDAYGEGVMSVFNTLAGPRKLNVVAQERYSRTDTSVIGQVLKLMAANPDAIMIAASGTPAALPARTLKERGYKGKIYFTDGVINEDFLRVGGKDVEGAYLPAGPFVVATQLPDSNPIKKVSLEFMKLYDAAYPRDPANSFSAHAWNTYLILKNAVPIALKTAQPGTKEFRRALRDAIENTTNLVTTHGIMNMSKTDHMGFDQRSRVMVQIQNGKWKLVN
ncbi:ABC transporter substrate-binding protein [Polaromonas sp. C04]|uniref:ABC transporter substrate-binding protein n=1 Tax=Polaromonas sp. C04 TaxID=1945857 RepID=UPI0009857470|nr:ABC transporter substrate-binding protein [Polaromonas sp. C04]OOG56153.1 branched-chain amino acid ABC transporter substrate-binding protein [Polaromonas sp. C04]